METAASAGEAEGGFVEALELELGVEGHLEHAEGKEEHVPGAGLAMRGVVCFQAAELGQPEQCRGRRGNLEDRSG